MSKVIIKFPYVLKRSRMNEMAIIAREQWEKGLLIINGYCDVVVRPDTDVVEVQWDEKWEHDLDWLCRLRSTITTGAINDSPEHVEEYREALDHVIDKMLYRKEVKIGDPNMPPTPNLYSTPEEILTKMCDDIKRGDSKENNNGI